ncbi:helix-turn-helix transcriptional regulator [Bacillus cereus]|uniref:helix-turn-helix domain-containing protein n=1 Tax=Bacillus cereus TaxID=1396 RepID=UPI00294FEA80|nr:helix-turn-helix transcriptional regulator [Bacillus cereus]MDV6367354.1 helix-turn-helix transcriptional regulator [Bacillus cereus]
MVGDKMRKRVTHERNILGLSQKKLAKELELSVVFIRKIEKGVRNPSRETMLKYQNFFGISASELFPDLFYKFNDTKCIIDKEFIG